MKVMANPYTIANAVLELGDNTFENACSKIELVPTYANPTFDAVDGSSYTVGDAARRTLELTYAQDHVDVEALHEYLLANDGTVVGFEFYPQSGGKGFAGEVLLRAGKSGGPSKAVATADVSLPVNGKVSRVEVVVDPEQDPEQA